MNANKQSQRCKQETDVSLWAWSQSILRIQTNICAQGLALTCQLWALVLNVVGENFLFLTNFRTELIQMSAEALGGFYYPIPNCQEQFVANHIHLLHFVRPYLRPQRESVQFYELCKLLQLHVFLPSSLACCRAASRLEQTTVAQKVTNLNLSSQRPSSNTAIWQRVCFAPMHESFFRSFRVSSILSEQSQLVSWQFCCLLYPSLQSFQLVRTRIRVKLYVARWLLVRYKKKKEI